MSCNHTYHGSMIPPTDGDFTIFAYIGGLIPNTNYGVRIKDKDGNIYIPDSNGAPASDGSGQLNISIDSQDVDFPPGFFVVPGQEYELYIVDGNNNSVDFLALQQYDKVRFKVVGGKGEFPIITREGCVCTIV